MELSDCCEVWRGGRTTAFLHRERSSTINISVGGPLDNRRSDEGITLYTAIPSKGGGDTRIRLYFGKDAFGEIIGAMLAAAPADAVRSIGAALAKHDLRPAD